MGLFDFLRPKDQSLELLRGMVTHNVDIIQKNEGKSRKDAEYIAFCMIIDDLHKRPNGREGYAKLMDILKADYPQHLNDVIIYVAWSTGKLQFKPEAEAEMKRRLGKTQPAPEPAQPLVFKSGKGFFELQCKYGHTKIGKGTAIVALVLDARKDYGTPVAVKIAPDGCQTAVLRVASDDGGFVVLAQTPSGIGDRLQPDDVILWVPSTYNEQIGKAMGDPRSGWVGFIRAKVKSEFDPATRSFNIICRYD